MKKKAILALALALSAATAAYAVRSRTQDGDALDPLRAAADTHRLAFENNFVRVLDVHVAPGQRETRHRHPHGLSVYFTDWTVRVAPDGGTAQVHERKAGSFAWTEAVVHTVENVGEAEGHVLRVELKF